MSVGNGPGGYGARAPLPVIPDMNQVPPRRQVKPGEDQTAQRWPVVPALSKLTRTTVQALSRLIAT